MSDFGQTFQPFDRQGKVEYATFGRGGRILKQQRQLQWRNRGCSVPSLSSDCFLLRKQAKMVHQKCMGGEQRISACYSSTAPEGRCSTQNSQEQANTGNE